MAALTVVEEEPEVAHRGWVPRPRGRKEGRRNWRLGRFEASVASFLCQCAVMADFTFAFQVDFEDGGKASVMRGLWREYFRVPYLGKP